MPRRKSKTAPSLVRARENEARAFELRKNGMTYAKIGEAIGLTEAAAHKAVKRVLDRLAADTLEAAEEVRRLELERLDAMLVAVMPKARRGGLQAVDRVLSVMKRRAALLGLDAPVPVAEMLHDLVQRGAHIPFGKTEDSPANPRQAVRPAGKEKTRDDTGVIRLETDGSPAHDKAGGVHRIPGPVVSCHADPHRPVVQTRESVLRRSCHERGIGCPTRKT